MMPRTGGPALPTVCSTGGKTLPLEKRVTAFARSLLFVVIGIQWGCAPEDGVLVLKAALSQNHSEPQVRAVELFADLVSEGTDGRIRVQVYPNNQLGNQRDVVEGLQMGSIELANIASVMASFVPEINLFELPFLFDGPEHFDVVMNSSIGTGLAPAFESRGMHLLGFFDVGERHIMTTQHPVERLEDLRC